MHKSARKEKGSSLFLVALFALILVALVWLGFEYVMMLRHSRTARNTVDAAVLNIAKRAPESRVPCDVLYNDVADSDGKVGLSNINRVWGKAYLINANVQEMRDEEVVSDDAVAHGDTAYRIAEWVNNKLQAKLSDHHTLNMYFQQTSGLRQGIEHPEEMKLSSEDGYKWAMLGRGGSSNLEFKQDQLPGKVRAEESRNFDGSTSLKGYTPFKTNSKNFCFVAFNKNEAPQLVSDSEFMHNRSDTKPIKDAGNPVSNAFSATGIIKGPTTSYKASAAGLANPQNRFTLALPRAYIVVQFRNRAKWYFENKWVNETSYGFKPEVQNGLPLYENKMFVGKKFTKGGGYIDGWASLGNEYKDAALSKSLEISPDGKKLAMEKMLQRIREIKADFSMADLTALFANEVVVPHAAKYYIYPVYHTKDLSDPEIVMTADLDDLPKWMDADSRPEGNHKIVNDGEVRIDEPNYCWGERVMGGMGGSGSIDHWTEISGKVWWKPGTGYGQCLGEMRYEHLTEIFFKDHDMPAQRPTTADTDDWISTGKSRASQFQPPVFPSRAELLRGPVNAGPKSAATLH
ncbi:MAG: hypothetical protein SGJ27_12725 [Candidatus Melainabacteria bacterium]|nr:hypothetical protein [Candidatus Melainabacteria bacterium]